MYYINKQNKGEIMEKEWKVSKEGNVVSLYRLSGKTFPCILFNCVQNMLYVRNDNGRMPSKTYSYEGASANSVAQAMQHVSSPHPSIKNIEQFLQQCAM